MSSFVFRTTSPHYCPSCEGEDQLFPMNSLSTRPFRQRRGSSQGTGYLCDAIAVIVIGTALAAMIGWMTGNPALVQVLPAYPPLYPGSALGLAAAAAGLWGLAHRIPRWVLTGAG